MHQEPLPKHSMDRAAEFARQLADLQEAVDEAAIVMREFAYEPLWKLLQEEQSDFSETSHPLPSVSAASQAISRGDYAGASGYLSGALGALGTVTK